MSSAEPAGPGLVGATKLPPDEVWRACLLIAASVLLSLTLLIPGITPVRPDEPEVPLLQSLTVFAVFGGLTLWLALKILQRRNWARWAMLAYLALSWLMGAQGLVEDFAASPVAGIIDVVCVLMEWLATGYLFFGNGPKWFPGPTR